MVDYNRGRWGILWIVFIFQGAIPCQGSDVQIQCQDGHEIIPSRMINPDSYYPESPIESRGAVLYVEYSQNRLMKWDGEKNSVFWKQEGCGPAAVTEVPEGYLVNCYDSNQVVTLSMQGEPMRHLSMEAPNDFAHDGRGGVYITSSSIDGRFVQGIPASGRIFYYSWDRQLREVKNIPALHYANGIAVSPDGAYLVVAETLLNDLTRFKIGAPGELETLPAVDPFLSHLLGSEFPLAGPAPSLLGPDGIRFSADRILFVAQYAGGRILKMTENKERLGVIRVLSHGDSEERYSNTTNIWVSGGGEETVVTIAAGQNRPEAQYPGIVFQVMDPQLRTRTQLNCWVQDH